MHTEQIVLSPAFSIEEGTTLRQAAASRPTPPTLALLFADIDFFTAPGSLETLRGALPDTPLVGCSTAGEIAGERVFDQRGVLTLIWLERSQIQCTCTRLSGMADAQAAGVRLAQSLSHAGLRGVLVLGTGVDINGSALVGGLQEHLPEETLIWGGLAADRGRFQRTFTLSPQGIADDQLVAVGWYGAQLHLHSGSFAGWEPFGPARKVTRAVENVLYELDGERALDIYTRYLGEYARDLPASGLLFPFEMLGAQREESGVFRTILGIDTQAGSLTLAGDIFPNGYLRLMHASTEKLIEGAETAAHATGIDAHTAPALALLVSCVGRKLVMGDRIEEEVEAVARIFGPATRLCGFYSNGEIAHNRFHGDCRLHNQTMTITWISERD